MTRRAKLIVSISASIVVIVVFAITKVTLTVSRRDVIDLFVVLFLSLLVGFAWIRRWTFKHAAAFALLVASIAATMLAVSGLLARLF